MCGRYELLFNHNNDEIQRILDLASKNNPEVFFEPKEIFPSAIAPVILSSGHKISIEFARWGFPGMQKNEWIINARSETVSQKPKFRQSFHARRCVIPATGFYEWTHDSQKKKYKFHIPDHKNIYMAGIWNEYNGEKHFVILTTAANHSMAPIHNRMPLIIPKEVIRSWIYDAEAASSFLTQPSPELIAQNVDPYEQLTFSF